MTATTEATSKAIDDVAAALIAAARTRTPRPPIKEMLPPNDVVAAYRVQAKSPSAPSPTAAVSSAAR